MFTRGKNYDVIIVPGFPYDPDSSNGMLVERLKWANYLYKNGYAKNIIFSGAAVHSPYIEAEIMRLYAINLDIPKSHLFTETRAEHTTENLYFSNILAKKLGFNSVAFATQTAQASFMKGFNRKWKLHVQMLPMVYSCIADSNVKFTSIDASSAFVANFIPLNEREGTIKRLMGTRGHKVKQERRKARKQKQE